MTTPLRPTHVGAPPALMLEVEHGLVTQFRAEAARRDMPVVRLIRELLDVIARDGLTAAVLDTDAVLDDGDLPSA